MIKPIRAFKLTDDDWSPCHYLGDYYKGHKPLTVKLVEVSFLQFISTPSNPDPGYRVCVWGNDDLGMERDYASNEFELANQMFHEVIALERVNKQDLTARGFVYA